jgi:hypothetical protein
MVNGEDVQSPELMVHNFHGSTTLNMNNLRVCSNVYSSFLSLLCTMHDYYVIYQPPAGWWFGTFLCSHILGMSSSQLTKSYFSEGLAQPPTSNCTVYINTETYGKLWKITIFNGNITIFNRKTMENHHF